VIVRNDTGVFEGGEISMFYDPMIAKLCTWAPSRDEAVEAMAESLDAFEVEGIGHNLPFLSAVMDHPRFSSGAITTAFIAEEYPDGFAGAALSADNLRLVAATAAMAQWIADRRASFISGPDGEGGEIRPRRDALRGARGGEEFEIAIDDEATRGFYDAESLTAPLNSEWGSPVWLTFADEEEARAYQIAWRPGDKVATLFAETDEEGHWREIAAMKIGPVPGGFRVRYRGADLKVAVMPPHVARLAAMMPEKEAPDTSSMLLCPMPGLVVALHVKEGEMPSSRASRSPSSRR
jgi:propionyl-CoA carboxylase alpha chain